MHPQPNLKCEGLLRRLLQIERWETSAVLKLGLYRLLPSHRLSHAKEVAARKRHLASSKPSHTARCGSAREGALRKVHVNPHCPFLCRSQIAFW